MRLAGRREGIDSSPEEAAASSAPCAETTMSVAVAPPSRRDPSQPLGPVGASVAAAEGYLALAQPLATRMGQLCRAGTSLTLTNNPAKGRYE